MARVLRFSLVILLVVGIGATAAPFQFSLVGDTAIGFFNNETGKEASGLLLRLRDSLDLLHCFGVGANMIMTETSNAEILFEGFVVPGGTWEVDWQWNGLRLESAAWITGGEVLEEIDVHAPTAQMVSVPGVADLEMRFEAVGSIDPDGSSLVGYWWEFEDGQVLEGREVRKTFPAEGEYMVRLVVVDVEGKEASRTASFEVHRRPPEPPAPETEPVYMLLFSLAGDMYTIYEDGTDLTQISFGTYNWYAKAGPGYEGIIFVSSRDGGGLFVADPDGSNVIKLSDGTEGALGWHVEDIIAYGRYGQISNLYTISPDGTNRTQITVDNDWYRVIVSPDGTQLLCHRRDDATVLMNIDGTNQQVIGHLRDTGLAWSPDGQYVTGYTSGGEIQIVDVDTLVTTTIATIADFPGSNGFRDALWYSPDGAAISLTVNLAPGETDVWIMDRDGGNPQQVTSLPGDEYAGQWSPDSDSIAIVIGDYGRSYYVYDLDTEALTHLADGGGHNDRIRWFGLPYVCH